jgi:hypothetical protein
MRQVAGVGVIFAVAVAALRLAGGPQTTGAVAGTAPTVHHSKPSRAEAKEAPATAYQGGCTVFDPEDVNASPDTIRGEARSVIRHFFDLKEHESLRAKPDVRFAIALAPDPRHTNLSLMFDREMVAIQQAAQDQGYNYNSSWLPWESESSSYPLLEDQQRAGEDTGRRESCPGVILFRKSIRDLGPDTDLKHLHDAYDEGLVVLVVGEQPTGGINQAQWANAIAWLHENAYVPRNGQADHRALHILGPTFSGSLVSLERDLAGPQAAAGAPGDGHVPGSGQRAADFFPSASTPIRILSGSVSRCSTARWFRHTMQIARPTAPTSFGSFQQSDELQVFRLLNYLKEQGTNIKDIAVVSEDETAYANSSEPEHGEKSATTAPCDFAYSRTNTPVRLSYPRDISALRSAYEKESLFNSGGGRGAHAVLQENAELEGEAANITDTIRSYSGSFTPVAEETVLYGLVSNLRAHHSRYIVLRCTNPLDFLFLTRFFHRAYPEGRIVTVGSDLLFRREIDTTEFRGVLALSSYPLLPREQHWSHVSARPDDAPPIPHTHRIPDSHMEGIYLAARYLFDSDEPEAAFTGREDPIVLPFKENLPDFADPFWMHAPGDTFKTVQAPVWLSVVGRDGYWPVAVLNGESTPNNCLNRDSKDEVGGKHQECRQTTDEGAFPPSAMVQIAGTAANGSKVHYDRDPEDLSRFNPYLRFSLPLSWEACAALAMFLLVYQVFGVWQGYRYTSSGLFTMFRRVTTPSQAILVGVNSAFALSLLLQLLMTGLELPDFTNVFKQPTEVGVFAILWLVFFGFVLWRFTLGGRPIDRGKNNLTTLASMAATILFLVSCAVWVWFADRTIHAANEIPLFFRMTHLAQGISPLVPILFLLLGFYLWTWQALAGNSLLCCGVPLLPELEDATFPKADGPWWQYWNWVGYFKMLGLPTKPRVKNGPATLDKSFHRISHEIGKRILKVASPLCLDPEVVVFPALLLVSALVYLWNIGTPLLGLEGRAYAWIVNIALLVAFLLTIAEAVRLFFTWKELQRLLTALSRLRLRRTFAKLRAVDSNSLWSVSGNVQRIQFHFFAQQLDAAERLTQFPGGALQSVSTAAELGRLFSKNSADKINAGPLWEMPVINEHGDSLKIRETFTDAVAEVLKGLIEHWRKETDSLSLETAPTAKAEDETERNLFAMELSKDPIIRTEEEFVCFHYIAFIQNILARMRTMILSMIYLFVSICLAISFYPFVPRNSIGMWMLINLVFIAASVIYVYAGMERDETLSYITNTRAGRLSAEFYLKTAAFLAGPVIGLLTTQFPAISESFLGWLQPGLDALK